MELVTVVVPIYNVKNYLDNCVKSIVNQTYKNLEIVLVDDGSKDGSEYVCEKWKEIDSRIITVHQKNAGLSAARNTGINVSTGEYISFVDSDDVIHPRFIELLVLSLKEYEADIAVCSVKRVEVKEEYSFAEDILCESTVVKNDEIWDRFYLADRKCDMNVAWNKIYRKELFETIRYPVGRLHEDEATTYKLLFLSNVVSIVDAELYYYTKRNDSISNSKMTTKRCDDYLNAIKERLQFIKTNKPEFYYADIQYELDIITSLTFVSEYPINKIIRKYGQQLFKIAKIKNNLKKRIYYFAVLWMPHIYFLYYKLKNR